MMLNQVSWPQGVGSHASAADEPVVDIAEVGRVLWRRRGVLVGAIVLAVGLAVVYLVLAPPRYTASAMVLFDPHKIDAFQERPPNPTADSAYVDSQVEVVKSDAIARAVIKNLHLDSDPEFLAPGNPVLAFITGLPDRVISFVAGSSGAPDNPDRMTRFVGFFRSNLTVKRVGLTYVADVAYRSLDPAKAAKISNAVVEAYILSELDSKYNAAHQTDNWLKERIGELKTQAQSAERVVSEYKARNNVIDSAGKVLSEPELADLSSQRRAALKDLESTAQTYRMLHEAFVQRATQQQSFPSTEARVASAAYAPLEKSEPKTILVLAAATLLGAVAGVAAAFAREHLRPVILTPSQIEKTFGIACLGVLPVLQKRRPRLRLPVGRGERGQPSASGCDDAQPRAILRDPQRYTCAADEPFSLWSEAVRFLAADVMGPGRENRVIGVSSALAGEGKSLVAANLAEIVADAGRKVLLVDCDLRNPGLTRELAPKATEGLLNAVTSEQVPVKTLVWHDAGTGLEFLPAPLQAVRSVHPGRALSSARMARLLASVRDEYDHVILDMPPIIPVADVKAASYLIDAFVLVVQSDRTPQATVTEALSAAPVLSEKLIGAVLNRASPAVLKHVHAYRERLHA